MIRAGIVGLGKMGLSHQSMVNAHPGIQLKAVCDTSGYVLDVLSKYTGVTTYSDYKKMLAEVVAVNPGEEVEEYSKKVNNVMNVASMVGMTTRCWTCSLPGSGRLRG